MYSLYMRFSVGIFQIYFPNMFSKYQNEFQYGAPMGLTVSALNFGWILLSLKRSACMSDVSVHDCPLVTLLIKDLTYAPLCFFLVPPEDLLTAPQLHAYVIYYCCLIAIQPL